MYTDELSVYAWFWKSWNLSPTRGKEGQPEPEAYEKLAGQEAEDTAEAEKKGHSGRRVTKSSAQESKWAFL